MVFGRQKAARLQPTLEEEIHQTWNDQEDVIKDLPAYDWGELEELNSPFAVRTHPTLGDILRFL